MVTLVRGWKNALLLPGAQSPGLQRALLVGGHGAEGGDDVGFGLPHGGGGSVGVGSTEEDLAYIYVSV